MTPPPDLVDKDAIIAALMARIEALVAQVEALTATNARLVARIAELEANNGSAALSPSHSAE
jgi:cell division protein FtsB